MSSFIRMMLAAALAAFGAATAQAATTSLNVRVQDPDGFALPGVKVAVIQYGMNGPSTHTQFGLTNALGNSTFTVQQQLGYSIFVTSHGYSPTIADQFNDPEYNPNRHFWSWDNTPVFSTFTLTSGLAGVGKISQPFTNATPNKILMGGIYNMLAQMPGASSMVETDGAGNGTLVVENVPFAPANTYNIGLYDPELNRGIGRNVMSDLGDGTAENPGSPSLAYPALNFNQSVPPSRVESNTQQGGSSAAGVSVEGVVHELGYATATVNHTGIGIKACANGMQWQSWAHTDENGRFQLFGLVPGTTYFFSAMGGCTWQPNGPGACYGPYSTAEYEAQDICMQNPGALNANDLLYVSSDVAYHSIKLNRMPPGTGRLTVNVVSSSGFGIPNAHVQVSPDNTPWPADAQSCGNQNNFNIFSSTNFASDPGYSNTGVNSNATGYALLEDLPNGNYMLSVWTPFSSGGNGPSSYNQGPDGTFANWGQQGGNTPWQAVHCAGTGQDDYRITVDDSASPSMKVYDSSGTLVAGNAITYTVQAGALNNSGLVRGRVSFPYPADLRENPVMLTLYPECGPGGPCGSGNFHVLASSGAAAYDYEIRVSSGASYWLNVRAPGWGRVQKGGNNMVSLQSTGTVTVDLAMAPAGTVSGKLYKPDGTVFTPTRDQWVWVGMNSERGYSNAQVQNDGSYTLDDVLTGENRAHVSAGGNGEFNYALARPVPTVNVTAGSTSTLNITLVNASYLGVQLSTAMVPDPTVIAGGHDTVIGFRVVPVAAGTVLKGDTIKKMLFGDDDNDSRIRFSPPTAPMQEGPCGHSWPGGFCANTVPSPSVYDLYLMRSGDFGDMSSTATANVNAYPHFSLLTSSKNVVVGPATATALVRPAYSQGLSSGVLVNMTPSANLSGRGNATLFGTVTADNFFREADYSALNGDFEGFLEYLPLVTLYSDDGAFRAAGIVVPPPSFIRQHDEEFDSSFAQGFAAFKSLLDSAGSFNFEIRGLPPSTCLTAVVTTPNYPPYQTKTCLGADRSTTTITVDLDAAVGAGATVRGVVASTAGVVLANATVELLSEGSDPRSAVTNSSGAYIFEGLPPGSLKVRASIDGYAPGEAEESVTGSNSYTRNFALTAAGGTITGTVYSQKLPFAKVQAGAQIVAYNDTYNGQHPDSPLPLIRTKTGADGTYSLTGLIPGDVYRITMKVQGRYTLSVSTPAVNGTLSGIDFTMQAKPLDIEIFAKKNEAEDVYEFTVLNPQDFKTGWAGWSASPFDGVNASTITLTKLSSGQLSGKIPLSSLAAGQVYVLQGVAKSYSGRQVVKEVLFGKDYKGNAVQQIDNAILGDDSDDGTGRKNNEVVMDKSGDDPTAIMFPPGAVLPVSSGAIPTCSFKGEDKDSAAVAAKVDALGADAFVGDLYTIALTSVTNNENKSIELTLAYDKSLSDLGDLSVARYNDATGEWEMLAGVATVNPVKGTVKVKVRSLATTAARAGSRYQANRFDGRQYRVSSGGGGSSGTFAVVKPSLAGNAYAGSKMKVFNYPNPFNLKSKAVTNANGAAGFPASTLGTIIHIEVPAANGGSCHVRIYTLAGELVNDLHRTCEGGKYNYIEWNGRNKGGREVANGVYYGVVELSGKAPDLEDATFKMVVAK